MALLANEFFFRLGLNAGDVLRENMEGKFMNRMPMHVRLFNALTKPECRLTDDKVLHEYAEFAYSCCVKWFGAPKDVGKPIYFVSSPTHSFCIRYRLGYYMIGLSESLLSREEQYLFAGHEMYHRVTSAFPGIREFIWIDEMMAALTSLKILTEYGLQTFADEYKTKIIRIPMQIHFDDLRNVRLHKTWMFNKKQPYSHEFSNSTLRFGCALLSLVSWESLCVLVQVHTLEQWFSLLPEQEHPFVIQLFSPDPLDSISKLNNSNAEGYIELAFAFDTLGNKDAAIAALQKSITVDATIVTAHRFLGVLLNSKELRSEAIFHWLRAIDLDPQDADAYYYLGHAYYKNNDRSKARYFLQTAVQLDNTNENAIKYLELVSN